MTTTIEEGRGSALRGSLSREDIVAAGLKIARRSDLNSVNMRELARELGVTPMAIYHHFESKRALIDGVIDRYVCETQVMLDQVDKTDWRIWLKQTYLNIYRSWHEAPGVQSVLSSIACFGPGLMSTLEETLDVLIKAGLPEAKAGKVFFALMGLCMGGAILQAIRYPPAEYAQCVKEKRASLDPAQYPRVVSVAGEFRDSSPSIEFELDLILDSVERLIEEAKAGR